MFHSLTWKKQYQEPFPLPLVDVALLEESDLQNWRFKPRSAGRPKANNRSEGVAVGASARQCGSCRQYGHNSSTCDAKDLDLVFKSTTGISEFYYAPVEPVVGPEQAVRVFFSLPCLPSF